MYVNVPIGTEMYGNERKCMEMYEVQEREHVVLRMVVLVVVLLGVHVVAWKEYQQKFEKYKYVPVEVLLVLQVVADICSSAGNGL